MFFRNGTLRRVGGSNKGGSVMSFYMPPGAVRPPVIDRGEGIYLIDRNGKRYIDGTSGAVVCNLGHSNPRVVATMAEQARRVTFAYPRSFESEANVELASQLTALAGEGFDRAFFVSGGSEANEAAIKLARQYAVATGQIKRCKVIARDPCYHGSTLGAMAVSGDAHSEGIFGPLMRIMPKIPAPLTYRLPPGSDEDSYIRACANALEEKIVEEGQETVLAFIMEPVGGISTGALVSPGHYYQQIRSICDKYGVLLIHDEVMSGAGRTGAFLSSRHWPDARPDLVTLAKGLAAGYTPFGAVLAPNRIVEQVAIKGGFLHGHTYAANPFSCAVALTVIREVTGKLLVERAGNLGFYMERRLRELQARCPIIGDVRGLGLLMAIELVADKETKQKLPFELNAPALLAAYGMQHGLVLYNRRASYGIFGDFQLVAPPLTILRQQIDDMIMALEQALGDMVFDLRHRGIIP